MLTERLTENRKVILFAFIDWDSQRHLAKRHKNDEPSINIVLDYVFKKIKDSISEFTDKNKFEIHLRLYHGWHKGYTATPSRVKFFGLSDEYIFGISNCKNIVIRSLSFGDSALGALERRKILRTDSHFLGTCRDQGGEKPSEKMVDTALVSDLIYCASKSDEDSWLVVLGEDIDLMPGVYTAEGFIVSSKRKIAFLRSKVDKYLNCDDIYRFNNGV